MTQAVGVGAGFTDWLPKLIFPKRQELIDDRERGRMTLVGVLAQRIHHSSADDFDGQKGRCLGLPNWPLAVRAQPATPSRCLKLLRPFAQALGSNALDLHRTAAPDDLRGAFPQVLAPAVIDRVVVAAQEGCNRGTNRFRMVAERLTTQHRGEFDDAHPMPGGVVSTWAQVYRVAGAHSSLSCSPAAGSSACSYTPRIEHRQRGSSAFEPTQAGTEFSGICQTAL
jgi:hypothetical protein